MEVEDHKGLYWLYQPRKTQKDLHAWVLLFLGVDLPGGSVNPDRRSTPRIGTQLRASQRCSEVTGATKTGTRASGNSARSGPTRPRTCSARPCHPASRP